MGWVPKSLADSDLDDLADVSAASPAEGDMLYRNDSGLWVVVGGTKGDGKAPMVQADGTVQWETPSGGGGSGALTLIDSVELGAAQTTITFSAIPGTHNTLVLRGICRLDDTTSDGRFVTVSFNNDTGTNYRHLSHNLNINSSDSFGAPNRGDFAGADDIPVGLAPTDGSGALSGMPLQFTAEIVGYASTTFHKIVTSMAFGADSKIESGRYTGVWRSTSAITEIDIDGRVGDFITGSAFYLYGVT